MKDPQPIWKALAKEKQLTASDFIIRCVLKSIMAKASDKKAVVLGLFQKAFTPITNSNKVANNIYRYPFMYQYGIQYATRFNEKDLIAQDALPVKLLQCLETEQEIMLYKNLLDYLFQDSDGHTGEKYSFIFIRQDLSKEQQVVQAAHVTLLLGTSPIKEDPTKLNFVVCGVKDKTELEQVEAFINEHEVTTVKFIEPDLNNEPTAIASYPMGINQKRFMRRFKTLKY